jgi:hypothetical protein
MIEYVKITNYLGEVLTMELKSPENGGSYRGVNGLGPIKV